MQIFDIENPSKDDEATTTALAKNRHGYLHFAGNSWQTFVIFEIGTTGLVLRSEIRASPPDLEPGSMKWCAIPDPGNTLKVVAGPWVEPRGELTYRISAEIAFRRRATPEKASFVGAMAALAGGYKLVGKDGSEYGFENAGDVFSWAQYNPRVAQVIRGHQRMTEHADRVMREHAKLAELLTRTSDVLGSDIAERLASDGLLSPVLLVPQYARALKALLDHDLDLELSRRSFRAITGVWCRTLRDQEDKKLILRAYASLR